MGINILEEAAWLFSYIGLAVLLAPVLFAYFMDGVAQDRLGYYHPYKWGYFIGLTMVLFSLPWLYAFATSPALFTNLTSPAQTSDLDPALNLMFRLLMLYPLYIGLAGLGIVMRRRWGWILFFTSGFLLLPLMTLIPFFMSIPDDTNISVELLTEIAGTFVAISLPGWIVAGMHVLYVGGRWTEMSKQHRNARQR